MTDPPKHILQTEQWLVEQADCMFNGLCDSYINFVDNRLVYSVDTKIHHVEAWGSFARSLENQTEVSSLDETEYRQRTTEWGKAAANYASFKWKQT